MHSYTSTFHLSYKSKDEKQAARVMKNIITAMELASIRRAYIAKGAYETGVDIDEKELLR
jgi:hypothetical protein